MEKKYTYFVTVLILIVCLLTSCFPETPDGNQTGNDTPSDPPGEKPAPVTEESTVWVDLYFVGDVMMADAIGDYIESYGADYPWTDVAPVFKKAHIVVANLETSVSTRGTTKKPEGYGFRSHPDTLAGLKNSGISMVSLANNHTLDFGPDALEDTLRWLDRYGISHAGAGANLGKALKPAVLEINGEK